MQRQAALAIMHEFIKAENLRHHMLAVEAALVDYAKYFGEDPHLWSLSGILHDFDWEIHPSMAGHPQKGAPILRERGVPEEVIRAILSHADHTNVARESQLEKALYAVDELTGLVTAVVLVRPSRSILDLKLKSVRKKWKDARFAAAVSRPEIEAGCAALGVELWEHVQRVIDSMKRIAPELDLVGTADNGNE